MARTIVTWYRANARDLPWRRQPYRSDPYAVHVSEVMLQQTQVKTVIPFWERWMTLFPTAHDLAEAPEERVLKAWEGLGYYRRARNLQRAARIIVEQHGGVFPSIFEEVLALPGVGRYTAGAICSIAFGQPTPILDGNVARVLSRVQMVAMEKELWSLAAELVAASGDCSSLNQGLMELGATVCVPRHPECPKCPLAECCAARLADRVADFPPAAPKAKTRQREFVALILRRNGAVLVRRRDENGVNGGLWEFPNFEAQRRPALRQQIEDLLAEPVELAALATIRHTITNNRITLKAFAGSPSSASMARRLKARWVPVEDLDSLPFSSAHAKLRSMMRPS